MVSGLPFAMANITFNDGDIEKNGVSVGNSTTVVNGDTIRISVSNYIPNPAQPNIFDIDISGIIVRWIVELSDPAFMGFDSEVNKSSMNDALNIINKNNPALSNSLEIISKNSSKAFNAFEQLTTNSPKITSAFEQLVKDVVEKTTSIPFSLQDLRESISVEVIGIISEKIRSSVSDLNILSPSEKITLRAILKENIYDTETLRQELDLPIEISDISDIDLINAKEVISSEDLDITSTSETLSVEDIESTSDEDLALIKIKDFDVDDELESDIAVESDIDDDIISFVRQKTEK